jgi:hypothetical protein
MFDFMRSAKQALPARKGASVHNRMRSLEVKASILGSTSVTRDELGTKLFGYAIEVGLMMCCCQAFGELSPD